MLSVILRHPLVTYAEIAKRAEVFNLFALCGTGNTARLSKFPKLIQANTADFPKIPTSTEFGKRVQNVAATHDCRLSQLTRLAIRQVLLQCLEYRKSRVRTVVLIFLHATDRTKRERPIAGLERLPDGPRPERPITPDRTRALGVILALFRILAVGCMATVEV